PANSRRAVGGTVERKAPVGHNPDYVGCTHNPDRFCAHTARAIRRALSIGGGGSGILPRRHRLSFALVHLSGPGQGAWAVYVRYSDGLYFRRSTRRLHLGSSVARHSWMAMAFPSGRRTSNYPGNSDAVPASRSA